MKEAEKRLKELEDKLNDAEAYGLNIQEIGGKIVDEARYGKDVISFLKNNKDFAGRPEVSSWISGACAAIPPEPPQNLNQIKSYYMAISSGTCSADVITDPIFYPNIGTAYSAPKAYPVEEQPSIIRRRRDLGDELDSLLNDFCNNFYGIGDLVDMRLGAWEVFNSPVQNNLMLASHSMRVILSKVISKGAPNELVKACRWWSHDKDTEEGVSERQRLRYLIFGPEREENRDSLEMILCTVKLCHDAGKMLKGVAHGSAGYKDNVKRDMLIVESALLAVLKLRKSQADKNL